MYKLLGKLVGNRELRRLTAFFVIAAVAQGVTLGLIIPFLRALFSAEAQLWPATINVVIAGSITWALNLAVLIRSYRVSVYEICDALIDRIGSQVMRLPLGWFDARREAAVSAAIANEVHTLSHVALMLLPNIVNGFVVPAAVVVVVAFVDWRLALIMAAVAPPLAVAWRMMRKAMISAKAVEDEVARESAGRVIEFARLQPVLRATRATERRWEPLNSAIAVEGEKILASLRASQRPAMWFSVLANLTMAAVLAAGLAFALDAQLDMAAHIAVAAVTIQMAQPLSQAVLYGAEVHHAVVALEAIDGIVGAEPLPEPAAAATAEVVTKSKDTTVRFENVEFGYQAGLPVLDRISCVAPQGKMSALIGPSGSGKSTMLRLVSRFWDVSGGAVTIGGVDVRSIPTPILMDNIAMVFQDVYLFDTAIRENLRMARPDATDEQLAAAAKAASLDKVIDSLPEGWDTVVGQGGLKLSGGERQRVSIARAFVKDAPILLLDEITSALDTENEAAITEVIRDLARGRTVIVVAHRESTIKNADQVIVLRPGPDGARIAEAGATPRNGRQRRALRRLPQGVGRARRLAALNHTRLVANRPYQVRPQHAGLGGSYYPMPTGRVCPPRPPPARRPLRTGRTLTRPLPSAPQTAKLIRVPPARRPGFHRPDLGCRISGAGFHTATRRRSRASPDSGQGDRREPIYDDRLSLFERDSDGGHTQFAAEDFGDFHKPLLVVDHEASRGIRVGRGGFVTARLDVEPDDPGPGGGCCGHHGFGGVKSHG
ncbi:MAG: ABC transporter ATP-binding protein/permease [Propionibacteriaceae bacterium]|jgi:ATP-binding cassette subfamily B protein|nr:ABC transporter ATP-binding protein/permease [Propionibacteriaceae bacterium]